MSEVCALEIMENNNMIQIKNKYFNIDISKDEYLSNIIKTLKIPYKDIIIKTKGDNFDKKFRELMKKTGYLCTETYQYGSYRYFVKKEDVNEFIKKLPKIEVIYLNEPIWFIEQYIKETNDIKIDKIRNHSSTGKVIRITNNSIKLNRIENEKEKEKKSIEFIEQLFK